MARFERNIDPKRSMHIGIYEPWIPVVSDVIFETTGEMENPITLDTKLIDDLGIDSLDAIEIIINLEQKFNISIDEKETADFKTIKDVIDYLIKKQ